ncbi:MAG: DUF2341 domain-containing protein, partial [Methanomassiliicoccales archaeon]
MPNERKKKGFTLWVVIMLLLSALTSIFLWDEAIFAKAEESMDTVTTITDPDNGDNFGWNVSWIGDVNGDGFDDIIAGAPYADRYADDIWWDSRWPYRRKLTFDNSGQSEDLVNFPVLINLSASNFNYSKAKLDGSDLRFIDNNGATELKYHIEEWDTSGNSFIWVNVTDIEGSSSSDYIWMYYNNSDASYAQDIEGTYDSNFSAVWHLNETSGTHFDATANDNDGTPQGGVVQNSGGKVDGADDFNGTTDYINCGTSDSLNITTAITIEAWVRPEGIDHATDDLNVVHKYASSDRSYVLYFDDDGGDFDDWYFKLSSSGSATDGSILV